MPEIPSSVGTVQQQTETGSGSTKQARLKKIHEGGILYIHNLVMPAFFVWRLLHATSSLLMSAVKQYRRGSGKITMHTKLVRRFLNLTLTAQ